MLIMIYTPDRYGIIYASLEDFILFLARQIGLSGSKAARPIVQCVFNEN